MGAPVKYTSEKDTWPMESVLDFAFFGVSESAFSKSKSDANRKNLERTNLKQNSRALHFYLLFPTSSIAASTCQESKHQKAS